MSDLSGALRSALGHVTAVRATEPAGTTRHDHLDHAASDLIHALGICETTGLHATYGRYQDALQQDTAHRQQAEHAASLERQSRNVNASHVEDLA